MRGVNIETEIKRLKPGEELETRIAEREAEVRKLEKKINDLWTRCTEKTMLLQIKYCFTHNLEIDFCCYASDGSSYGKKFTAWWD